MQGLIDHIDMFFFLLDIFLGKRCAAGWKRDGKAGWGRSGNQEIANNATYALYSAIYGIDPTWDFDSGSAYDLDGNGTGQLPSGFTLIRQGNAA